MPIAKDIFKGGQRTDSISISVWIPASLTRKQMPSNLLRVHRIEHRRHDGHRDGSENEISELARLRKSGDERTSYHIEIIVNNPLDAADDTAILRRHRFLIDLHDLAVKHPQARARRHETGDQSDHQRRVLHVLHIIIVLSSTPTSVPKETTVNARTNPYMAGRSNELQSIVTRYMETEYSHMRQFCTRSH